MPFTYNVDLLRERMTLLQIQVVDISKRARISRNTVAKMLAGQPIRPSKARQICDVLGLAPESIVMIATREEVPEVAA